MHPNIKLARKFSKYYPPIELPADKNDWHIGHQCLAVLEDLYPRRDLLITTLLDSYEIDRRLENIRQLRNNYLKHWMVFLRMIFGSQHYKKSL